MQPWLSSPFNISLLITQTCNLECKHCYADCSPAKKQYELTTDQWINTIEYLAENEFVSLYFEGGEPFARPDFLRILAHATPKMMTLVRSNGTLIDKSVASELKRIGVGRVLIDLFGATDETHDYFAGVKGSFAKACNAISSLHEAQIEVDTLTILNRRNAGEIQDVLKVAHDFGASRAGILRLYPLGRAKMRWGELALSLDDQMSVLAAIDPPEQLTVMQSWHPNDRNCCWQSAAIDPFGRSIGCAYLREYVNYGNILDMPFLETWNDPLYRELRSGNVEKSCSGCEAREGTRGGCRSAAYAFHGSWQAPDPFCSDLNDGVDLRALPARLLS
jgi:radical SAM protein with 4Fe4S-binding SPASM domain